MTMPAFVELAISLSFLYLMLSILSSSVLEYLAQSRGWRGRCMRAGLRRLIEDRWIYMAVIRHPSVASLYRDEGGRFPPPSYMPPENFAESLLDVLLQKAISLDPDAGLDRNMPQTKGSYALAAQICAGAGYAIGSAVLPFLIQANSIEDAKTAVGKWYDTTMSRVSGSYKRETKKRLLLIGFTVAVLFNIDSISVTAQLLRSSNSRSAIADMATASLCAPGTGGPTCQLPAGIPVENLSDIKVAASNAQAELGRMADAGLPLGYACLGGVKSTTTALTDDFGGAFRACKKYWRDAFGPELIPEIIFRVIGWLITAVAISFGAEFWFDIATKFINLRGSGPKPKSTAETTA
ncbi:MAG: hypothetical protein AAAC47_04145 [Pararhizobium sp.]